VFAPVTSVCVAPVPISDVRGKQQTLRSSCMMIRVIVNCRQMLVKVMTVNFHSDDILHETAWPAVHPLPLLSS
jgi:hypothetical protein